MARVWYPRDPAVLRGRLGGEPLGAWAEGDILHVLWQGQADEVQLVAGVQPRLWPVDGAGGLWEASLRIRRLEEARWPVCSHRCERARRRRGCVMSGAHPGCRGLPDRHQCVTSVVWA